MPTEFKPDLSQQAQGLRESIRHCGFRENFYREILDKDSYHQRLAEAEAMMLQCRDNLVNLRDSHLQAPEQLRKIEEECKGYEAELARVQAEQRKQSAPTSTGRFLSSPTPAKPKHQELVELLMKNAGLSQQAAEAMIRA